MKVLEKIGVFILIVLFITVGLCYAQYMTKGVDSAAQGKFKEAKEEFEKAIRLDPKYAEAYNERGRTYARKGHYDQAISDYTKAIEIDPKYALAYTNRGLIHIKKGNKEKACSDWKRACNLGNCKILNFAKKVFYCQ